MVVTFFLDDLEFRFEEEGAEEEEGKKGGTREGGEEGEEEEVGFGFETRFVLKRCIYREKRVSERLRGCMGR